MADRSNENAQGIRLGDVHVESRPVGVPVGARKGDPDVRRADRHAEGAAKRFLVDGEGGWKAHRGNQTLAFHVNS